MVSMGMYWPNQDRQFSAMACSPLTSRRLGSTAGYVARLGCLCCAATDNRPCSVITGTQQSRTDWG